MGLTKDDILGNGLAARYRDLNTNILDAGLPMPLEIKGLTYHANDSIDKIRIMNGGRYLIFFYTITEENATLPKYFYDDDDATTTLNLNAKNGNGDTIPKLEEQEETLMLCKTGEMPDLLFNKNNTNEDKLYLPSRDNLIATDKLTSWTYNATTKTYVKDESRYADPYKTYTYYYSGDLELNEDAIDKTIYDVTIDETTYAPYKMVTVTPKTNIIGDLTLEFTSGETTYQIKKIDVDTFEENYTVETNEDRNDICVVSLYTGGESDITPVLLVSYTDEDGKTVTKMVEANEENESSSESANNAFYTIFTKTDEDTQIPDNMTMIVLNGEVTRDGKTFPGVYGAVKEDGKIKGISLTATPED